MTESAPSSIETLRWVGDIDGHLVLIDQTRLPIELVEIECRDVESVFEAIRSLRVRGAPAIGIAAAYGLVIGLQDSVDESGRDFQAQLVAVHDRLAESRPTAVNLFWALDRMSRLGRDLCGKLDNAAILTALLDEARAIHEEDRTICRAIGRYGAELLKPDSGVLTHCNAGGLATADYGTALAVFFAANEQGKRLHVFVDETRPLLQGSRLTAWELKQRGIDATLICDSMAAQVMREGRVQAVVTGADRVAANGDAANKIGTYSVALSAAAHDIPFYIAAPTSTFDLSIASGDDIPIEQRAAEEITHGFGRQTAPDGIDVYNPAFDVTPAHLIAGIITEHGVIQPVTPERIAEVVSADAPQG
ncbi:MAG: S-methyl-5-thioribose-1-phosphate isomerase [Pirellulales bacterium]|nr:S-methyl-5-thioribose-1-phosphate isomerase [Pirellulales bacterium]